MKGHVHSLGAGARRESILSWESMCGRTQAFHHSASVYEWWYWFWSEVLGSSEFTDMESANNDDPQHLMAHLQLTGTLADQEGRWKRSSWQGGVGPAGDLKSKREEHIPKTPPWDSFPHTLPSVPFGQTHLQSANHGWFEWLELSGLILFSESQFLFLILPVSLWSWQLPAVCVPQKGEILRGKKKALFRNEAAYVDFLTAWMDCLFFCSLH